MRARLGAAYIGGMIELLDDAPRGTIGMRISGEVTPHDYQEVLVPAIEVGFAQHDKLNALVILEPGFRYDVGALWEDTKLGLRHPASWNRVALVTDAGWARAVMPIVSALIPGEARAFGPGELEAARAWVTG